MPASVTYVLQRVFAFWSKLTATHVPLADPYPYRLVGSQQTGEIKALAGVDFLTISPALLEELKKSTDPVPKKLDAYAGGSPSLSFLDLACISNLVKYTAVG